MNRITFRVGSGPPGPRRRWWHPVIDHAQLAAMGCLTLLLIINMSNVR
jgi:hypothetical protein